MSMSDYQKTLLDRALYLQFTYGVSGDDGINEMRGKKCPFCSQRLPKNLDKATHHIKLKHHVKYLEIKEATMIQELARRYEEIATRIKTNVVSKPEKVRENWGVQVVKSVKQTLARRAKKKANQHKRHPSKRKH